MLITSIHAPHAGCDNPRRITSLLQMLLQSTHLHAGCDGPPVLFAHHCLQLQFTHPRRGATTYICAKPKKIKKLQSTHPMRGVARAVSASIAAKMTSIHAPQAGATSLGCMIDMTILLQSTRPHGARPREGCDITSIHAPHAGCD